MSVTTATLPAGTVDAPYAIALGATGGTLPYTWSLASGDLPAGLGLDQSSGVISGTLTTAGVSSFTVEVTDADGASATRAVAITVNPPLSITTLALPNGTVGVPYSSPVDATGGTLPYSWSVVAGALPDGLTISAAGVISGTPTTAGVSGFSTRVDDDAAAAATAALLIDVEPPVTITTTSLPAATVGVAYLASLTSIDGTPPYTWSLASGTLPAGLTIGAAGVISGTPTIAGTSPFTARRRRRRGFVRDEGPLDQRRQPAARHRHRESPSSDRRRPVLDGLERNRWCRVVFVVTRVGNAPGRIDRERGGCDLGDADDCRDA